MALPKRPLLLLSMSLCTFLLLAAVPAQIPPPLSIYVDGTNQSSSPDGTVANPWTTLKDAFDPNHGYADGVRIFIAPGVYEDVAVGGEEDGFPYPVKPGVRIEYWDRAGNLPGSVPPVEFTGASQGSSGNGYAFALKEGATVSADCGLFGFLDIASPAEPEDRAGFVFRNFDDGAVFVDQLGIYPWAANWRWNVDGCLVEDCARFVNVVSGTGVKKDGL